MNLQLDLRPSLSVSVRGLVPSTANLREHKREKAARVKTQRNTTELHVLAALRRELPLIELPLVVVLTRVAPLELDSDNLASATKAHRDGATIALARYFKQTKRSAPSNDSDRLRWLYAQEKCRKGEEALRVDLYPSGGVALWMLRHLPTESSALERWIRANAGRLDALLVTEVA